MAEFHKEQHYPVGHWAKLWQVDEERLKRIFEKEPDVIRLATNGLRKRRYTILRVPESVAERVHRRLSNG